MLKRKIDLVLKEWKDNSKKAILIKGARQVGKTYSIQQFIKNNFGHYVEINFAYRTDLIDSFAKIVNPEQFLLLLSSLYGEHLVKGDTVIFFDEIQLLYKRRSELKNDGLLDPNSQDIITSIKSLVMDGSYRYILSGSLLGVTISDVILHPTGYMQEETMYPLDFEEYLWAKGVGVDPINYIKKCFKTVTPVMDAINERFLSLFREYVLIGGMPEAVSTFLTTNNLYQVQVSQKDIVEQYLSDITRYFEEPEKKLRVREVYKAIPSELNSKNKRYQFTHIVEPNKLRYINIIDDFLWLTNAGVAIPAFNVTEPILPLAFSVERKTLKLFMNDNGLLASLSLESGTREKLLLREKEINYGAPYENAVAQELNAHGFEEKLYYYNSKKHGEVDFVVEYKGDALLIEVKSGKPNQMSMYNHSALNNLLSIYSGNKAFVFGECNIKKESDRITQFPIYMVSFIRNRI